MKRVFIIEDNLDIARVYKTVFKKSGYEVSVVFDGEEAVKMLLSANNKKPDVILLDIILPKMDGFKVLEKIKGKESNVKDVPVLAMTNLDSLPNADSDLNKIKALGAKDVIIKCQLDPKDIVRKVENLINSN